MSEPVMFYKARRYRILPTDEQAGRLQNWMGCLTALWNDGARFAAHSQRLWRSGMHKPASPKLGHLHRIYMATKAQDPDSDFARLPSAIVSALSNRFDLSIQAMYKGDGRPGFKNFDLNPPTLEFPVYVSPRKGLTVLSVIFGRDSIQFPNPKGNAALGLGRVRYVKHQHLCGKPKTATIIQEGGKYYILVVCEVTARPRAAAAAETAIDIRLADHFTMSAGGLVPQEIASVMPAATAARLSKREKQARRALSRCKRNSRRRKVALACVSKATAHVAAARRAGLHAVTSHIATTYGFVAVEKLAVKKMVAIDETDLPRGVRRDLNREVLAIAPATFRTMLASKMKRTAGVLVEVNPAYTSQTCSGCGAVDARHAKPGLKFKCASCGHQESAPLNACRNIMRLARQKFDGSDPVGSGSDASPRKTPSDRGSPAATSNGQREPVFGPASSRILMAKQKGSASAVRSP